MSNKDPFFIVEEDEGVQAEKSAKKQIPDIQSHTPRDIDVNYYGNNILTGVDPALLTNQDDLEATVRHTLFPALSYLLLPSNRVQSDGFFTVTTKLSTLYKVFERC